MEGRNLIPARNGGGTNATRPHSATTSDRWSIQAPESWRQDNRGHSDNLASRGQYHGSWSTASGDSSPKIAPRTYSDKPVLYYNPEHTTGSVGSLAHLRLMHTEMLEEDEDDDYLTIMRKRRNSLPTSTAHFLAAVGEDVRRPVEPFLHPAPILPWTPSPKDQTVEDDEDDDAQEALLQERREAARRKRDQDANKSFLERYIHPTKRRFRFMMLFLFCITAFGHMYNYDSPSALVKTFKDPKGLHISDFQYDWFYSIYSWPNVVMAVLGGIIVDLVGRRFAVLLFCGIVFVGQVVWATGFQFQNYWIMLAGRFVFGIGSESLTLTMDYLVSYWFYGNEVILAMGILISNESLSDCINFLVSPIIASHMGAVYAPWSGTIVSAISLAGAFVVAYFDKKGQDIVDKEAAEEAAREREEEEEENGEVEENSVPKDISILEEEEESESFRITDLRHLSFSYWVWVAALVSYYCCSFPFVAIAVDWISDKWEGYSEEEASRATSCYSLAAIFFAPTTGVLLDKYGGLGLIVIIGPLGTLGLLVLWGTVGEVLTPYVLMLGMGILYSCAAAMQGGVPRLVPERFLGTAYGLSYSLMNLCLAVANMVVGYVQGQYGWDYVLYIFLGLATFSTASAVFVNSINQCCWGKLNWSKEKMAYYETLETMVASNAGNEEPEYSINPS